MTPTAPILTLLDALVARVRAAWKPVGADGVERLYDVPVQASTAQNLTGRRVWLFPSQYDDEPETRGEDRGSYRVSAVVAERYADAGPAPAPWVDERVDWVWDPLLAWMEFTGRAASPYLEFAGRRVWTQFREAVEVYSQPMLAEHKLFWSRLVIVFQEVG